MDHLTDLAERDPPIFAIVAAEVGFDQCRLPIEPVQRGEVDAVLAQIVLAFGLVPVPHLYAYIKLPGKGECGVGRVKVGLRVTPLGLDSWLLRGGCWGGT